jgi:hypothetical protein
MDNKSVTQQMFEDFLSGVSQSLEEEARAEFPGAANCYRVLNDFGHYCLVGFAAPGAFPDFPTLENEGVTAVLFHGIDSTAPGDLLVKVPLCELVICDCGDWQPPEGMKVEDQVIQIN